MLAIGVPGPNASDWRLVFNSKSSRPSKQCKHERFTVYLMLGSSRSCRTVDIVNTTMSSLSVDVANLISCTANLDRYNTSCALHLWAEVGGPTVTFIHQPDTIAAIEHLRICFKGKPCAQRQCLVMASIHKSASEILIMASNEDFCAS